MEKLPRTTLIWLFLACQGACGPSNGRALNPAPTGTPTPGLWTLAWSDEFDGAAGAGVDRSRWTFDIGGGGWGNDELESYTDRLRNASLDGQGSLVILADREGHFMGQDGIVREYTSARLKTQGLFSQAYGRFEARVKIPYGQGLWPAFWMLGADIETVGWPSCGEIDIMENIGREPSVVHGSIHAPQGSSHGSATALYALPVNQRFADDFHIFAVEWDTNEVRWYVDGALYETRTPADLPAGARWVFDQPFFIVVNLAVGGSWPGAPDATTVFPQHMVIDYVRVYKH